MQTPTPTGTTPTRQVDSSSTEKKGPSIHPLDSKTQTVWANILGQKKDSLEPIISSKIQPPGIHQLFKQIGDQTSLANAIAAIKLIDIQPGALSYLKGQGFSLEITADQEKLTLNRRFMAIPITSLGLTKESIVKIAEQCPAQKTDETEATTDMPVEVSAEDLEKAKEKADAIVMMISEAIANAKEEAYEYESRSKESAPGRFEAQFVESQLKSAIMKGERENTEKIQKKGEEVKEKEKEIREFEDKAREKKRAAQEAEKEYARKISDQRKEDEQEFRKKL